MQSANLWLRWGKPVLWDNLCLHWVYLVFVLFPETPCFWKWSLYQHMFFIDLQDIIWRPVINGISTVTTQRQLNHAHGYAGVCLGLLCLNNHRDSLMPQVTVTGNCVSVEVGGWLLKLVSFEGAMFQSSPAKCRRWEGLCGSLAYTILMPGRLSPDSISKTLSLGMGFLS